MIDALSSQCWVWRWNNNFEIRSTFAEVMGKNQSGCFFLNTVYIYCWILLRCHFRVLDWWPVPQWCRENVNGQKECYFSECGSQTCAAEQLNFPNPPLVTDILLPVQRTQVIDFDLIFCVTPMHSCLPLPPYTQWLKWGGLGGAQPPAPIWAPCNSMSPPDWIYKVLFYA